VIEVGERRGMRSGRVGGGGRRRWRVGVVGAEVVRELSRWKIEYSGKYLASSGRFHLSFHLGTLGFDRTFIICKI
jgi:hypothetical protein